MKKLYFSIALLFACNVLNATTFQVLNTDDSGPNSLRQCIADANSDLSATYQDPHKIVFNLADGRREISLLSALPAIDNHMVIDGQSEYVKISGGTGFRVFKVNSEKYVNFNWLLLTKGKLASGNGGCIYNSGFLTLNNVSVDGNEITGVGDGGGIYNEGYLELTNSWVINNHNAGVESNFGGGIYNSVEAVVNISQTTIGSNWASAGGGGVMNDGDATFSDMTFVNNMGGAYGGGLYNRNNATLTNVTIFNTNQAQEGGAIATSWSTILINNTITTNEIGGGIFIMENSSVSLLNTIVTGNEGSLSIAKDDIYSNSSVTVSANHCLLGNVGSLITLDGLSNKKDITSEAAFGIGSTKGLFNGSKTETISLTEGALAINAGTSKDAPTYDQCGQERVGQTDIGAFEYQTPVSSITKQQQNDLKIFSNPGNGLFRFELANNMRGDYEWKVIDINGRVLQSSISGKQSDTAFDLSSQPQGIYILIISSDRGIITKEVVKL